MFIRKYSEQVEISLREAAPFDVLMLSYEEVVDTGDDDS